MNEKTPSNEDAEKILNEREVLNAIEEIIGSSEYEIFRSLDDEGGLWVFEVRTKDENGDLVQYNYRRNDNAGDTVIDVVFFEGDMPVGGHAVKKYKEGKWVMEVD